MNHSLTKLWTHVVFSTRNNEHLIMPSFETRLYDHICQILMGLNSPVRIINGISDHVHILFLQNPRKSLSEIIKQVKGNSSYWINQNDLTYDKFAWQSGYAAFSVSESQVFKVYQFILHQKAHHLRVDFEKEYSHITHLHGLSLAENITKQQLDY